MNNDIAILEFRPGTGGEEAKIWASDLMRMYSRYANIRGWQVMQVADNTIKINGDNAYTLLQNESGVHRVQRIPTTERYGRIHTSTATVAVLPEIPDADISLNPADLQWEFFRSGGKGGQNVNKVSSAVRVRHIPSGITVECQSQRDQFQNRQTALSILKGKLWETQEEQRLAQLGQARSSIGRAMRSEKIRTYNYPQSRIKDHRIGKSWHNLEEVMDGKLDKIISTIQQSNK